MLADLDRLRGTLAAADALDQDFKVFAVELFDISQRLASVWSGLNSEQKRTLLTVTTSNRVVTATSLKLTWSNPFDILAETLALNNWYTRRESNAPPRLRRRTAPRGKTPFVAHSVSRKVFP